MQYRRDIDGLRAIAVIPVILYHAGFNITPGGFAGVDVFFVLSGYLITALIFEEIASGQFSIISFYERRTRRIAPALLFVSLLCIPFAWMWMLPPELNNFGKSLYHVNLFISNFLFWQETGYFSPSNDLKPLIHTWSLAVEEQFYIVFPLILMAFRRRSKPVVCLILAVLSLFSFALTQIIPIIDPVANFYLLPSRFWELGSGGALAVLLQFARPGVSRRNSVLACAGLVLILATYCSISADENYPGWATVPVVAGTLMVLAFSSHGNLTGRLLGWGPFVTIGLWSYSLYLWHQPLFAFARLRLFGEVSSATFVGLIAVAVVLAYLTYRFVERPFRDRTLVNRRTIFCTTGIVGGLLIVIGLVGDKTDGFVSHFSDIAEINAESFGLDKKCNGRILPQCQTSKEPEVAIWGDSYAMHLIDGVIESAPDVKLVQFYKSNCGPFRDMAPIPPTAGADWPMECLRHNDDVLQYISSTPSLKYVLVSSPFTPYLASPEVVVRGVGREKTEYELTLKHFIGTLDWLSAKGLKPVVFAPPPQHDRNIGLCFARTHKFGVSTAQCEAPGKASPNDAVVQRFLDEISLHYPVLDMRNYLCRDGACEVVDGAVPLYQDSGHLSRPGSRHLGRTLHFYAAMKNAAEVGCHSTSAAGATGVCQLSPDSGVPFRAPAGS